MAKQRKFKSFLNFLVESFNGMAYGLFATLIIGVIVAQIANLLISVSSLETFGNYVLTLSKILQSFMGIGIGIGIAYSLKQDGLKLVVLGLVGGIAQNFKYLGSYFGLSVNNNILNDPMVVYLSVIAVYFVFKYLLKKKTPVDIILIPLLGSIVGFITTFLIGFPIKEVMTALGKYIQTATDYQPILMGVVIAVLMGMFLTMPISSAAIAISISLGGIAGGAAVVGCSVQMVGFMVMSRKDNNLGTVISIGIGTSMLQFKNIIKKPIIWLPTIIVSAILGPISSKVLLMETNAIGSGMGTSGLVGQIATFDAMGYNLINFVKVISLHIIIPIVLVYLIDMLFRKKGLILEGDLKV